MSKDIKVPKANLNALMEPVSLINTASAERHGNSGEKNERVLLLLTKATEELGELGREVRSLLGLGRQTRAEADELELKHKVANEASDVFIAIIGMLVLLEITDIDNALFEKLHVVIKRLQDTGHLPR